jgi:hypothetical protein
MGLFEAAGNLDAEEIKFESGLLALAVDAEGGTALLGDFESRGRLRGDLKGL